MSAARGTGEQVNGNRAATRHGQATRDAIVEAAQEILQYEGVAGVSTRHIAARAGVNQALVHYHFGSVNQVMAAVLERIAGDAATRQRSTYEGEKAFGEKLRADLKDVLDQDQGAGWGRAWVEAAAYALNAPDALEGFAAAQVAGGRAVEGAALDALGRKDRDAKRDAEAIASLVSIVRTGLLVQRLTSPAPAQKRAVELLGELLGERVGQAGAAAAPAAKAPAKAVKAVKSAPAKAAGRGKR